MKQAHSTGTSRLRPARPRVVVVSAVGDDPHDRYVTPFSRSLSQSTAASLVAELRGFTACATNHWPRRRVIWQRLSKGGNGGLQRLRSNVSREVETIRVAVVDRPSVVHLQDFGLFTPLTAVFLRSIGVRVSLTLHNLRPHNDRRRWVQFERLRQRAMVSAVNGIAVHGETLAREAGETYSGAHILSIRHPVEEPSDAPGTHARPAENVLTFGVLRPSKSLESVLQVAQMSPSLQFKIVGSARGFRDYGMRLHAQASGLDNVKIEDRVVADADVAVVFADATVCLIPYTSFSAQSGVLFEAIARGLPVAVRPCPVFEEILGEFPALGELASDMSDAALSEALIRAIARQQESDYWSTYDEARAELLSAHSWESQISALIRGLWSSE